MGRSVPDPPQSEDEVRRVLDQHLHRQDWMDMPSLCRVQEAEDRDYNTDQKRSLAYVLGPNFFALAS